MFFNVWYILLIFEDTDPVILEKKVKRETFMQTLAAANNRHNSKHSAQVTETQNKCTFNFKKGDVNKG